MRIAAWKSNQGRLRLKKIGVSAASFLILATVGFAAFNRVYD